MDDLETALWVMEGYAALPEEDRAEVMRYMGAYINTVRPSVSEAVREAEAVIRGILSLKRWIHDEK